MERLARRLLASWARPRPDALARLMWPLALLYGALSALRRALYSSGWLRSQQAPVPVLVVGNLVAGGAGKTPTVISLLPRLRALGYSPGVISRGHGRQGSGVLAVTRTSRASDCGDEPLLIHLRTGAPVVVGTNRVAAARALCALHPEVDLLVADDGLQHLRLARQATVLVFDDRGAGNGLLLPAGPLRQPLPAALPPATLVLYTAGQASTTLAGVCGVRKLGNLLPLADWWAGLGDRQGAAPPSTDGWAALQGRPVLAVAGLARPEAFFSMLEARGLQIARLPLPDHAPLQERPWPADGADVVLTEKDAIKLGPTAAGSTRIWVAGLDFTPEPAFDAALRGLCAQLPPRRPPAPNSPTPTSPPPTPP